jgi:hypothetical protein
MSNINKPVPGEETFYPLNEPAIGEVYRDVVSQIKSCESFAHNAFIIAGSVSSECKGPCSVSTVDTQRCYVQEPDFHSKQFV